MRVCGWMWKAMHVWLSVTGNHAGGFLVCFPGIAALRSFAPAPPGPQGGGSSAPSPFCMFHRVIKGRGPNATASPTEAGDSQPSSSSLPYKRH